MSPGRTNSYQRSIRIAPYVFLTPFTILFVCFSLYPVIFTFILAFAKWDIVNPLQFVGWRNFVRLFQDLLFWMVLGNGVILWFMQVPFTMFGGLTVAYLLNQTWIRWRSGIRAVVLIPYVVNIVAVGFVFRLIYNTNFGIANAFLQALGLGKVEWLTDMALARFSLSTMVIWLYLGTNMLVCLAGLQQIPEELYEAAAIDGASRITTFFRVVIPSMRQVLLLLGITSTVGTFSLFAEPLVLTERAVSVFSFPDLHATDSLLFYAYRASFGSLKFGYGAAISVVFLLLMVIMALVQFRLARRGE